MIRYLENADIDKSKWDAAIDSSPHGMVYAKSWFLDIVSPGWQALVDDNYKSVFPLTGRKKFGISYLHQPFFTQQLGVFSDTSITAATVEKFLTSIPASFRLVEIHLNLSNKITRSDFSVSDRFTHHLNLANSYETLQKNYSDNLKRNLKRAHQNNLAATSDFSTTELIYLFKKNRGRGVETLKENDYMILEKLIETAHNKGLISKYAIRFNGALEAGAIFLKSNHEYVFLFSATGEGAKETGAMSFLVDHFIKSRAGEKKLLDFEGSMDPGLARFYKSFGSDEVVYLQIRKNNLPLPLRWLKQ
jgi:hypothetical protein